MLQQKILVQNKLGLHTRAAAKLVALASKYDCKIELKRDDQIANCKSIMALILLGVTKGLELELALSGADELEARDAIMQLFAEKFGEAE